MAENSQWYYTDNNGQQAGPVSLAELKTMVQQSSVTGSSMVWSEGMENWKMISEVDGLNDVPSPTMPQPTAVTQTAPAQAASEANPYAPPQTQVTNPDADFHQTIEYPGIRRLNYFCRILLLVVAFVLCAVMAGAFSSGSAKPTLILLLIGLVAFLIFYIRFALQRIRNIGASGWWLLLMLVPIASNILGIFLLACPEGFADHKKMDTAGIVVAVILGGLTLLSFIGNVATVFM